jgi:6-phosphogluconate dehydrogenase
VAAVVGAVDVGAPATLLSAALYDRFASRGEDDFAAQLLSAMRKQCGGHAEITAAAGQERSRRRPEPADA